jgi:hypothetical protein
VGQASSLCAYFPGITDWKPVLFTRIADPGPKTLGAAFQSRASVVHLQPRPPAA